MFLAHNVLVSRSLRRNVTPMFVQCGPNGHHGRNVRLVVAVEDAREDENVQHQHSGMVDIFAKGVMTLKKKFAIKM